MNAQNIRTKRKKDINYPCVYRGLAIEIRKKYNARSKINYFFLSLWKLIDEENYLKKIVVV